MTVAANITPRWIVVALGCYLLAVFLLPIVRGIGTAVGGAFAAGVRSARARPEAQAREDGDTITAAWAEQAARDEPPAHADAAKQSGNLVTSSFTCSYGANHTPGDLCPEAAAHRDTDGARA
jgi:hypothetical protein